MSSCRRKGSAGRMSRSPGTNAEGQESRVRRLRRCSHGLLALGRSPSPGTTARPVASHDHVQVGEVGLDCADSHRFAKRGVRATLPNIETCTGFLDGELGETAEGTRIGFLQPGTGGVSSAWSDRVKVESDRGGTRLLLQV